MDQQARDSDPSGETVECLKLTIKRLADKNAEVEAHNETFGRLMAARDAALEARDGLIQEQDLEIDRLKAIIEDQGTTPIAVAGEVE